MGAAAAPIALGAYVLVSLASLPWVLALLAQE